MKYNFNGWSRGFLRWVAVVGPVLIAIIWLDARYITKAQVMTLKENADNTHANLSHEVNVLSDQQKDFIVTLNRLNNELARLNGYLDAQKVNR